MSEAAYIWLCFGGVEIINACATSNFQANGAGIEGISCGDCNPCCEDLNLGLGVGAGGPNIAQAPWYDPNEPLSVEFAGLLVTSVTGLEPGPYTRSVTEAATIGALLGQARQSAPTIVVTGILLGSCCGVEYGLSWLRSVLRGPCSTSQLCQGSDLRFLSCPPVFPDEDCPDNEGQDYSALLDGYIRSFRNVALVDGPNVSNRISHGCPSCHDCPMLEITFTLAAADPCIYREPVLIDDAIAFTPIVDDTCIEWVPNSGDICVECPDADDCATDPDCTDVEPPSIPSITSSCIACLAQDRSRACFNVPAASIPTNGEATLHIEVFAGDTAMRAVQIVGWHNPLSLPVDELEDCAACFGLNISYIGPSSTLVIDGAARTAMIECPGKSSVRANPFIASGSGSPAFTFPVLTGCQAGEYTICVSANDPINSKAFVSATLIGREC